LRKFQNYYLSNYSLSKYNQKDMKKMARRSITIEFALLGFLQEGPLHGYQLHQQLNDPHTLGRVWRVKQARVYALLDQLERDGYITSSIQQQDAYPTRRV